MNDLTLPVHFEFTDLPRHIQIYVSTWLSFQQLLTKVSHLNKEMQEMVYDDQLICTWFKHNIMKLHLDDTIKSPLSSTTSSVLWLRPQELTIDAWAVNSKFWANFGLLSSIALWSHVTKFVVTETNHTDWFKLCNWQALFTNKKLRMMVIKGKKDFRDLLLKSMQKFADCPHFLNAFSTLRLVDYGGNGIDFDNAGKCLKWDPFIHLVEDKITRLELSGGSCHLDANLMFKLNSLHIADCAHLTIGNVISTLDTFELKISRIYHDSKVTASSMAANDYKFLRCVSNFVLITEDIWFAKEIVSKYIRSPIEAGACQNCTITLIDQDLWGPSDSEMKYVEEVCKVMQYCHRNCFPQEIPNIYMQIWRNYRTSAQRKHYWELDVEFKITSVQWESDVLQIPMECCLQEGLLNDIDVWLGQKFRDAWQKSPDSQCVTIDSPDSICVSICFNSCTK